MHTHTYTQRDTHTWELFGRRDGGMNKVQIVSLIVIHINFHIKYLYCKDLLIGYAHKGNRWRQPQFVELTYEESMTILNIYVPNNRATK